MLNAYLASVFTRSGDEIPTKEKTTDDEFKDVMITEERIKKVIENMDGNKAPGPDGITVKLMKNLINELAEPLAILFRASIDSGKIPDDWRQAEITPSYKKGTRFDMGNYRGINLTPVPGKIMERIVKEDFDSHIETNEIQLKSAPNDIFPDEDFA